MEVTEWETDRTKINRCIGSILLLLAHPRYARVILGHTLCLTQVSMLCFTGISQPYVSRFLRGEFSEMSPRSRRTIMKWYMTYKHHPTAIGMVSLHTTRMIICYIIYYIKYKCACVCVIISLLQFLFIHQPLNPQILSSSCVCYMFARFYFFTGVCQSYVSRFLRGEVFDMSGRSRQSIIKWYLAYKAIPNSIGTYACQIVHTNNMHYFFKNHSIKMDNKNLFNNIFDTANAKKILCVYITLYEY